MPSRWQYQGPNRIAPQSLLEGIIDPKWEGEEQPPVPLLSHPHRGVSVIIYIELWNNSIRGRAVVNITDKIGMIGEILCTDIYGISSSTHLHIDRVMCKTEL